MCMGMTIPEVVVNKCGRIMYRNKLDFAYRSLSSLPICTSNVVRNTLSVNSLSISKELSAIIQNDVKSSSWQGRSMLYSMHVPTPLEIYIICN